MGYFMGINELIEMMMDLNCGFYWGFDELEWEYEGLIPMGICMIQASMRRCGYGGQV